MAKTNKFFVKKYEEDKSKITVEEERKYRSPFILFLVNNGRLILTISLLLSISVFIIGVTLILNSIKDSSIVMYEENGVVVSLMEMIIAYLMEHLLLKSMQIKYLIVI